MKLKNNILIAVLTTLIISTYACKQQSDPKENTNPKSHGDLIIVSDQDSIKSKLKEAQVSVEDYGIETVASGTVKAIPTQYAEIASPFQGRVTKSFLKLGMKTTAQTALFEISSPDFIAAQKLFFQEKLQMKQAERALKRQKDLMTHGVGSQKELEEAQTNFDVAKKEYENALIGLKIFKANPEKLSLGQPLTVYAPINGEIIENKVVLGQFIKDDAASVALVANLSTVWAVAEIKEKDLPYVHENNDCEIEIATMPGKKIKAKIYRISSVLNEETRSVQVFIECNNLDKTLKPGLFVNVSFKEKASATVVIPSKALFQMNDSSYVFIVAKKNTYKRKKVTTAGTIGDKIVIKSGLSKNDKIVTEGGLYLL